MNIIRDSVVNYTDNPREMGYKRKGSEYVSDNWSSLYSSSWEVGGKKRKLIQHLLV